MPMRIGDQEGRLKKCERGESKLCLAFNECLVGMMCVMFWVIWREILRIPDVWV